MRTELRGRRNPVTGSTKEIGRANAQARAASGAGVATEGCKKADVACVVGESRGTVPSGRLVRAPANAARRPDILFDNVGS